MSTKNIKAGLSKTNVNAIAGAIGTATLNRLVPQFSTSVSYTKGQYTNYNNQLYRFTADKSAGAWDSTKVESATLQDLVDDVNDAVASVNGKANIIDLENGTLVVAKSLTSKQLENVSDESGSTQDAPFNFQATGTDNNTTETPTAPIAKHLELRGNTVAWNQLVPISAVETTTSHGITFTNNGDGSFSVSGTADDNAYRFTNDNINLIANHKYLLKGNTGNGSATTFFLCAYYNADFRDKDIGNGVVIQPSANTTIRIAIRVLNGTAISGSVKIIPQLVDLTILGKEYDSALSFNRDYPLPYYSYNAGELKSASSGKLITIGCNAFDGVLESGGISGANGNNYSNDNAFRSKNYIKVIAGQTYIFATSLTGLGISISACFYWFQYDSNKAIISFGTGVEQLELEDNCQYLRFMMSKSGSGWGLNVPTQETAQMFVRLYWNESHDFVEYVKHEYDLPQMAKPYSAGEIANILKSDGTEIDYVDSYTFTGSETFVDYSGSGKSLAMELTGAKPTETNAGIGNIKWALGVVVSTNDINNDQPEYTIAINTSGRLYIATTKNSSQLASALAGKTIYFELATPTETTDETKAFVENIEVDDFGTMEFVPASGNVESASNPIVPQGNQFFYPADYVLLIDDLNNYLNENEADTTDLVLRKELLPKLPSNSEDGTYTLKATKSGSTITYAWVKDE